MNPPASVIRTVEVAVDPSTAFQVFTEEIGAWYRPGPYSWNDPARAVGIRLDPGLGGRLVEVHDEATGEGFEMGRVLAWEPGARLLFQYRSAHLPSDVPTEVEVRFEPTAEGTRVTLEHRGLDRLPLPTARMWESRAWIAFMGWFRDYVSGLSRDGGRSAGSSTPD